MNSMELINDRSMIYEWEHMLTSTNIAIWNSNSRFVKIIINIEMILIVLSIREWDREYIQETNWDSEIYVTNTVDVGFQVVQIILIHRKGCRNILLALQK